MNKSAERKKKKPKRGGIDLAKFYNILREVLNYEGALYVAQDETSEDED